MGTIQSFIYRNGIESKADWRDSNPNMPNSTPDEQRWNQEATHWSVKLTRKDGNRRTQLTVPFSQGSAHTGEPESDSVLDCLASDASTIENARGFEDWASDLGYDPDSRKAERTYRAIVNQTEKLRRFLGPELFNELLWETERL